MSGKFLLYVIDPMCSWCWGFSPIFDEIIQRYEGRVTVNILVGGLRPGNFRPFDAGQRDYVLQHWKAVHKRTGQPFEFTFHMSPDFTYDTEPPSRALKVVRRLAPAKEHDYLKAIQQAFYLSNTDVTSESVLCQIAERLEVHRDAFLGLFRDPVLKQDTWNEFAQIREWGVDSFPTLLGRQNRQVSILVRGCQARDQVMSILDEWLIRDEEDPASWYDGRSES